MSPQKFTNPTSDTTSSAVRALWIGLGIKLRDARLAKRWSVETLATKARLSRVVVYRVEAGHRASPEAALRIAHALGVKIELDLVDMRRRADIRPSLTADRVHSAMGELEANHLRARGFPVGMDEPYQHYQFAGRADLVAWDLHARALLHIENRTRFPDLQDMAGAYNAKRAYLGNALAERLGIGRWASETHVIAALWTSEVLHALRLRTNSFRSICPDGPERFAAWWGGRPPERASSSTLIVVDPTAAGRSRVWIDIEAALTARPRFRGYADAAAALPRG